LLAVATGLAKGGREFKLVTMLVTNATAEAETGYVRVKLHTIPMPHRKLLFWIATIRLPRRRVPRPYFEGVEQV
jgi:hypothetical protein